LTSIERAAALIVQNHTDSLQRHVTSSSFVLPAASYARS